VHRLKTQRGQALVEFALILPLLLTLVIGIFDLGTAYNYQNDMSQLANEAARYASVGNCDGCVAGNTATEIPAIVKADADTGALRSASNGVNITIGFPPGSNGCQGDAVQAVVTKHYTWVPYLHLVDTTIHASATMRLETAYNSKTSPYTPSPGGSCPSS
jgi:Flp pilus assembly protein TadG